MTRLREGQPLAVRGEGLAFSFWPLKRGQRRWGLNSMLYTANPWAVIGSSLERCLKAEFASAKSFVRQEPSIWPAWPS